MKVTTTLQLGGKTATGFEIPAADVESLGGGRKPAVTVTANGYSYRTTIAVMGGRHLIPVAAAVRAAAGLTAGDVVELDIVLDTAPRTVEVPADLAAALGDRRAAFDALSYTNRKEAVRSVEDAKTEATRLRRIDKVVASLS